MVADDEHSLHVDEESTALMDALGDGKMLPFAEPGPFVSGAIEKLSPIAPLCTTTISVSSSTTS